MHADWDQVLARCMQWQSAVSRLSVLGKPASLQLTFEAVRSLGTTAQESLCADCASSVNALQDKYQTNLTTLSVRVPVLSKHTMLMLAPVLRAFENSRDSPALSSRVRAMCASTRKMVGMLGGAARRNISTTHSTICLLL